MMSTVACWFPLLPRAFCVEMVFLPLSLGAIGFIGVFFHSLKTEA